MRVAGGEARDAGRQEGSAALTLAVLSAPRRRDCPIRHSMERDASSKEGSMKGNILIVEDDLVARNALAEIIQAQGYVTSSVSTVAEAVESLDGKDCAVIDMNLPDGLGTYILRRIRDDRRPIRAAVLSGTSEEPLLRWAVRYGAEVVMR